MSVGPSREVLDEIDAALAREGMLKLWLTPGLL